MNGMNFVLPLLISGFGGLAIALAKAGGAAGLLAGILNALKAHPVIAALSIFTAAVGGLTLISGLFNTSAEKYEKAVSAMKEAQEETDAYMQKQDGLIKSFLELSQKTSLTTTEQVEYNKTLEEMRGVSMNAKVAIDNFAKGQLSAKEAAEAVNGELEKEIER